MHQRSQIGYENWNKFIVHTSGYGLRVTWVKALTDCIAGIAATDRISCKKINQSLDKFLNPLHQVSLTDTYLPKLCSQVSVERMAQVSWFSSQAPVHTFKGINPDETEP